MVLRNSKILEGRSRVDPVVFCLKQLINDDSVAESTQTKVWRPDSVLEGFGILYEDRARAAVATSGAEVCVNDQIATFARFQYLLLQRVEPLWPRMAIARSRDHRVSLDGALLTREIVV